MLKYPFIEKVGKKKKRIKVLHAKKSLFECISPIMATNRPRKKKCHAVKSAICLWQMCITGEVIFFIVRSCINAETKSISLIVANIPIHVIINANWSRKVYENQLHSSYMCRQLPLILANSITTNKSQSMTAHNGIVYEP